MTESEWLSCQDPQMMLMFLRTSGRASDRKLRLFAVACCRLFWDCLSVDATRAAIETSEGYADNQVTEEELSRARSAAHNVAWDARSFGVREPSFAGESSRLLSGTERLGRLTEETLRRLYFVAFMTNTTQRLRTDEMPMLSTDPLLIRFGPELLLDIFGNPFRAAPAIEAAWLIWNDGTVKKLAEAAYEQRSLPDGTLDQTRLAVLADALEEAGCTDEEVLGHLRGPGPHVRGCHAVDILKGKA
jgi:hypothetical protein